MFGRYGPTKPLAPPAHTRHLRRLSVGIALGTALALGLMTVASASPNAEDTALRDVSQTVETTSAASAGVAAVTAPSCPAGQAPLLKIARYPSATSGGAATAEASVRALSPSIGALSATPWSTASGAPVWFTAGTQTFIATVLPDGTWFASPATFVACKTTAEIYGR